MVFGGTISLFCGFAFCMPPDLDGGFIQLPIIAFLFIWCSGWNFGCSRIVKGALDRHLEQGRPQTCAALCCVFLIPHVIIGLIIPFFMGGIVLEIIGIWPYYIVGYQALKKYRNSPPEPPLPPPEPVSEPGTVMGELVRVHSDTYKGLARSFSSRRVDTNNETPVVVTAQVVGGSDSSVPQAQVVTAVVVADGVA
eukprot:TRINITY_DN28135_c0_g1_i1.p1 TRINITY_DN28135_c0_g1~~TRINITY_DN28135_c0_g1_i1.p1  ORF type:complete len:222 (+),score=30.25 TRINITY_DN28135_c0_g1_i1:83-667(+)